jgi:hypothetical protein
MKTQKERQDREFMEMLNKLDDNGLKLMREYAEKLLAEEQRQQPPKHLN